MASRAGVAPVLRCSGYTARGSSIWPTVHQSRCTSRRRSASARRRWVACCRTRRASSAKAACRTAVSAALLRVLLPRRCLPLLRRPPLSACAALPLPPLTQRARARSDAGLAPRQDRLLRGHGPAERRQRGVADRRARRAAPRHHLPHLQHEQADHLRRAHDALRGGQVPALRSALAAPRRRLEEGEHGGETHPWSGLVPSAGLVPDGCAAAGRSTSPATRRRATSAALSRRRPARRR